MQDDQNQVIVAIANMLNHVDQRFDQISSDTASFRNDVMTKMDAAYKEVQDMRQEQSAHQAQHEDIDIRLDDIEAVPAVAHD